ncbi:MAG: hypothetical protein K2X81_27810, partial [Candidatus Obscuribacterales bacterium]|nr:hypothetical protein [Candidatus Obscuribacterales bacterium]
MTEVGYRDAHSIKFEYDSAGGVTSAELRTAESRTIKFEKPSSIATNREFPPDWRSRADYRETNPEPDMVRLYRGVKHEENLELELSRGLDESLGKRYLDLHAKYKSGNINPEELNEFKTLIAEKAKQSSLYTDDPVMALRSAGSDGTLLYIDIPKSELAEHLIPHIDSQAPSRYRLEYAVDRNESTKIRESIYSPSNVNRDRYSWTGSHTFKAQGKTEHLVLEKDLFFGFGKNGKFNLAGLDDLERYYPRNHQPIKEVAKLTPADLAASGYIKKAGKDKDHFLFEHPETGSTYEFKRDLLVEIKTADEHIFIERNRYGSIDEIKVGDKDKPYLSYRRVNRGSGMIDWPASLSDAIQTSVQPGFTRLYAKINSGTHADHILSGQSKPEFFVDRAQVLTRLSDNERLVYVDIPTSEFLSFRNSLNDRSLVNSPFHANSEQIGKVRQDVLSPTNDRSAASSWMAVRKTQSTDGIPLISHVKTEDVQFHLENGTPSPEHLSLRTAKSEVVSKPGKIEVLSNGAPIEFKDQVLNAIDTLPVYQQEAIKAAGIKVRIVKRVEDIFPTGYVRERPRGYSSHLDYSSTPAFFSPSKKEIVLVAENLAHKGISKTVRHEVSHGLDLILGASKNDAGSEWVVASASIEARRAFEKDLRRLRQNGLIRRGFSKGEVKELSYFL